MEINGYWEFRLFYLFRSVHFEEIIFSSLVKYSTPKFNSKESLASIPLHAEIPSHSTKIVYYFAFYFKGLFTRSISEKIFYSKIVSSRVFELHSRKILFNCQQIHHYKVERGKSDLRGQVFYSFCGLG